MAAVRESDTILEDVAKYMTLPKPLRFALDNVVEDVCQQDGVIPGSKDDQP